MAESDSLPFMNSTGLIVKILDKIIEAQTPPKFTQDFQATKLGYGSGSARAFIPLLKRLKFISADGTPTELYKKFRNSATRGTAMAEALKIAYAPLYTVSEYAHDLDPKKFRDAVIQVTGHSADSSSVNAIVGSFKALKNFANFDETASSVDSVEERKVSTPVESAQSVVEDSLDTGAIRRGMNLSYTINLNLPETKDLEVFDAIFSSLKAKLLS